ncbi:MAG: hypothetical protein ACYDC3_18200, partial [Candidatus Binataceae bacterium]
LFAIYIFHVFTDVVFLLPGTFVMFLAAGYGAVLANRWAWPMLRKQRKTVAQSFGAIGAILLDAILVVAIGSQAVTRLSALPVASPMVAALEQVDAQLPPDATIVSNISLQFLQLYIPGSDRKFVGLSASDPGESFTDYHLNRLFVKRTQGWTGPIPPTLFVADSIAPQAEHLLAAAARTKAGVYLLLCAPESQESGTALKAEMAKLGVGLTMTPLIENSSLALFRLSPAAG